MRYNKVIFLLLIFSTACFNSSDRNIKLDRAKSKKQPVVFRAVDTITSENLTKSSLPYYFINLNNIKLMIKDSLIKTNASIDAQNILLNLDSVYNNNFPFKYEGSIDEYWHLYRLRSSNFWILMDTKEHFRLGFGNEVLSGKANEIFPSGLMVLDEFFRPELRIFIDSLNTGILFQTISYDVSNKKNLFGYEITIDSLNNFANTSLSTLTLKNIHEAYCFFKKKKFSKRNKVGINVSRDYRIYPCWENPYCILPWSVKLRDTVVNGLKLKIFP